VLVKLGYDKERSRTPLPSLCICVRS